MYAINPRALNCGDRVKLPKKVIIAGREYKVEVVKGKGGGHFDSSKPLITIGTAFTQETPGVFLHEVAEALLAERRLRYQINHNPLSNGDYLFVMNHDQFEDFIFDLAYALKDYLK